jgi:hypothetical protein
VTRAIRQEIVRISAHHPELGKHLDSAIRTGTYCAYDPDVRGASARGGLDVDRGPRRQV